MPTSSTIDRAPFPSHSSVEQTSRTAQSTPSLLAPTPFARSLPSRLCRRGAALLNLQCWLWGQDIRRTEGNLLLHYGADRLRPPKDVTGCSQYSFALTGGTALKLWGFGIYVGKPDRGCYLNRYEFVPRVAGSDDCWNAEAFRAAPRNPPLQAIPEALRWIANYERWVLRETGTAWRLASSAAGPDSSGTALTLATHWSALARDIERWSKHRASQPLRAPALAAA